MLRLSAEDSSETVHSGILTRGSFMRWSTYLNFGSSPTIFKNSRFRRHAERAAKWPPFRRSVNPDRSVGVLELRLEVLSGTRIGGSMTVGAVIVIGGCVGERRHSKNNGGRERERFEN